MKWLATNDQEVISQQKNLRYMCGYDDMIIKTDDCTENTPALQLMHEMFHKVGNNIFQVLNICL